MRKKERVNVVGSLGTPRWYSDPVLIHDGFLVLDQHEAPVEGP